MKWILIIVMLNGGVSSVEFDTENACLGASIDLNLASLRLDQDYRDYTPHVETMCVRKGQ